MSPDRDSRHSQPLPESLEKGPSLKVVGANSTKVTPAPGGADRPDPEMLEAFASASPAEGPARGRTIPLTDAFKLLKDADAVLADFNGRCVMFPGVGEELTGDPGEEFLNLRHDEEGEEFTAYFEEGDNQEVEVQGASLILIDTEGNSMEVTPLFSRDLS